MRGFDVSYLAMIRDWDELKRIYPKKIDLDMKKYWKILVIYY